jgi:hypothetical protein
VQTQRSQIFSRLRSVTFHSVSLQFPFPVLCLSFVYLQLPFILFPFRFLPSFLFILLFALPFILFPFSFLSSFCTFHSFTFSYISFCFPSPSFIVSFHFTFRFYFHSFTFSYISFCFPSRYLSLSLKKCDSGGFTWGTGCMHAPFFVANNEAPLEANIN